MIKKLFLIHDKDYENTVKLKVLGNSKIPIEFIEFKEIHFNDNLEEYVHVMVIDNKSIKDKKELVFLHGLTGSCIIYYNIFEMLMDSFRIIAIDIPGMGCSSRNDAKFKFYQDSEDFFITRLKDVICDKMQLKNFTLIGHSLGGYLGSLFTTKYPDMIDNLILLSPVGISSSYKKIKIKNKVEDFMKKAFYQIGTPPSFGYKLFNFISVFAYNKMFDTVLKNSYMFQEKDKIVYKNFVEFLNCLMRNYCTSEQALFHLFDKDIRAFNPITLHYKKIENKRILIFYGDTDWNPVNQAEDLKDLIPSVEIKILKNTRHVIYPDEGVVEMCEKIIDFVNKI